jgi:hypothetical protein
MANNYVGTPGNDSPALDAYDTMEGLGGNDVLRSNKDGYVLWDGGLGTIISAPNGALEPGGSSSAATAMI